MKEEWKDIKGYEGLYQVSNLGRIYRLPYKIPTGKIKEGYEVNQRLRGKQNRLYYSVKLRRNGAGVEYYVHRLVANEFVENEKPDKFDQVHHINNDKLDNRAENLQWVNNQLNIQDSFKTTNRMENTPKGSKNRSAKLTEEDVKYVWKLISEGYSNNEIINKVKNLSKNSLSKIITGKNWKHIQPNNMQEILKNEGRIQ